MNVLNKHKVDEIEILLKVGLSGREIERKLGIRRETVSKYAKIFNSKAANPELVATGNEIKTGQADAPRPPAFSEESFADSKKKIPKHALSACEPHREWIEQQVAMGRNAQAIFQDLVEQHGFANKYNSVKRFCRGLKAKDPQRFDVLEFLPGEEAQVDYGQGALTLYKPGRYKRPYLFVMTLKYSGKSFRKVVWHTSQETWAKLHEEAFRSFGGCTLYVVLDNLKEGVIKPDIYEPILNPVYAAMLAHYGVIGEPCRVRDPDRKGTVENAIQHTQNTALKGRKFETIEEQNQFLEKWEANWAAPRIHGRKKRQVLEMFNEEKQSLKALPLEGFRYFKGGDRTVSDAGLIQVENSYYAALPAPLFSKVQIRIYEREIEIYDLDGLLLRRHEKAKAAGHTEMLPEDRIFNPTREIEKALLKLDKIGPRTAALARKAFITLGRSSKGMIYGLISLARIYEKTQIEAACERVMASGSFSYQTVKRILEKCVKSNPQTELIQAGAGVHPIEEYQKFWEINSQSNKEEVNNDNVYH